MYEVLLGAPIREGRLRVRGLHPVLRVATMVGLVALAGMLGSLLFNEAWRYGELSYLSSVSGRAVFVPIALIPITLGGLCLAWMLILSGTLQASLAIRILGSAFFLTTTAFISDPLLVELSNRTGVSVTKVLIRVSFLAVPVLVALYSAASRRRAWEPKARTITIVGICTCLAIFFGANFWLYLYEADSGLGATLPTLMSGNILSLQYLLIPLVYLGAVGVIEFSYGVAEAAAVPAWAAGRDVARVVVLAFIAIKLWIQLFSHLREWATYVSSRPSGFLFTLYAVVLFGVIGALTRSMPRDPDGFENTKERVVLVLIMALALANLFNVLAISGIEFLSIQFGVNPSPLERVYPSGAVLDWGPVVLSVLVLAAGIFLLIRDDLKERYGDWAIALTMVGVWSLPLNLMGLANYYPGFNYALLDLFVTIAAAGYILARWGSISTVTAVRLGAVVAFSWLFATKGDFLSIIGGWFGLASVAVLVFGILFTLLAGSSFALEETDRLPARARPLIWVGYLLLSATMLNWLLTAHDSEISGLFGSDAILRIGIPLAVWFLLRRPFESPPPATAAPDPS